MAIQTKKSHKISTAFIFILILFVLAGQASTKKTENKPNIQVPQVATVQPKPQPHTDKKEQAKQKVQAEEDIVNPDLQQEQQVIERNQEKANSAQNQVQQKPDSQQRQNQQNVQTQQIDEEEYYQAQAQDQQPGDDVQFQLDPVAENVIEKEQEQYYEQQIKENDKKLHDWVASEMDVIAEADSIKTHEIFAFQVDRVVQFKWDPTQFKPSQLKFVVQVFTFKGNDVMFADNPNIDDYIEVFVQPDNSTRFKSLGKVYLKKMFSNFFSDYQLIRLQNHYTDKMLVQVSLQATKYVPQKALDDDNLKIPAQKIESILEQLKETEKKREKYYRSEWSIRDRQEHHQSEMLILTGVQLIFILGTAIVQMYCIKNLFDNRLIV